MNFPRSNISPYTSRKRGIEDAEHGSDQGSPSKRRRVEDAEYALTADSDGTDASRFRYPEALVSTSVGYGDLRHVHDSSQARQEPNELDSESSTASPTFVQRPPSSHHAWNGKIRSSYGETVREF